MRLLYVVQRYGVEVAGGAEKHCRDFAERLVARGHEVDVLTSSALSYVDWADHYEPGTSELNGVQVHRLPVVFPRDQAKFDSVNARTVWGERPVPLLLQRSWLHLQGPTLSGLEPWLAARAATYDVVVFITYMYYPTVVGLPVASGLTATVLHPTAHDEPMLYLSSYELVFRTPHAHAFLTEDERVLLHRRFGTHLPGAVVGVGVEPAVAGDPQAFRQRYGIGDRPYLLYVGRVDPSKGSVELYDYFVELKRRHPSDLALVVVGDPVVPLPPHDDVVITGFVDDAERAGAMAGAVTLVHPSYFESFSMVLAEAWAAGLPALVQGRCDVLRGQARRSGGGLPYEGFASFEASVEALLDDPGLRAAMGAAGREYVTRWYSWDTVLDGYERLLERAQAASRRGSRPRPPATIAARG